MVFQTPHLESNRNQEFFLTETSFPVPTYRSPHPGSLPFFCRFWGGRGRWASRCGVLGIWCSFLEFCSPQNRMVLVVVSQALHCFPRAPRSSEFRRETLSGRLTKGCAATRLIGSSDDLAGGAVTWTHKEGTHMALTMGGSAPVDS